MKAMKNLKKTTLIAAFVALTALVGGCNTVEGVGRDIEHAGESIQKL